MNNISIDPKELENQAVSFVKTYTKEVEGVVKRIGDQIDLIKAAWKGKTGATTIPMIANTANEVFYVAKIITNIGQNIAEVAKFVAKSDEVGSNTGGSWGVTGAGIISDYVPVNLPDPVVDQNTVNCTTATETAIGKIGTEVDSLNGVLLSAKNNYTTLKSNAQWTAGFENIDGHIVKQFNNGVTKVEELSSAINKFLTEAKAQIAELTRNVEVGSSGGGNPNGPIEMEM